MYQTIVYIWQRVQMEDGLELWVFCGGFSGRANEEEKKGMNTTLCSTLFN